MATIRSTPEIEAYLDLIAESEGTSSNPVTRASGYDIIVTGINGPNRFDDYSTHPFANGRPPILVRHAQPAVYDPHVNLALGTQKIITPAVTELRSTASGRYQITRTTWENLVQTYKLSTFGAMNQDVAALYLLAECHAKDFIHSGMIQNAIACCAQTWASFPGNDDNQGGRSMQWLLDKYTELYNALR